MNGRKVMNKAQHNVSENKLHSP